MNAKETIRKALKSIMSDGEANACQIWKGYGSNTGRYGWHVQKFGETAMYYGTSAAEAVEMIENIRDSRETA